MEAVQYNESKGTYKRVSSREVQIGGTALGGDNPIRLQSMTNTSTMDIDATVAQSIRIIEAGADYVRITAPGIKDAEALQEIKKQMLAKGYKQPLIADIHYNPRAAVVAAKYVDKVRINPGNYVDKKKFELLEYTDEEYQQELDKIRINLLPLIEACKENNTAIRIGVNHGSLSDRIMSRYGDTPRGMVVSLIEFLTICIAEDFHNIALSIKASNTLIMVQACRMVVAEMKKMGAVYPLHLGVTEAGEGEDGRIKSAVGIGTLLADGIGDTVRVSLTEDPEAEIPVARVLVDYCTRSQDDEAFPIAEDVINPFEYVRRKSVSVTDKIGGDSKVAVVADCRTSKANWEELTTLPEFVLVNEIDPTIPSPIEQVVPYIQWTQSKLGTPRLSVSELKDSSDLSESVNFVEVSLSDIQSSADVLVEKSNKIVLIVSAESKSQFREIRASIIALMNKGIEVPIIISLQYSDNNIAPLQLHAAADAGGLLLDGLGDGVMISAQNVSDANTIIATTFAILQASRVRFSKTEYISCPSCGRTMFGLQETAKIIRERTSHLTGLKIGIMGCIVNGPGEMADADYGYVGAGPKKINLYKQKNVVHKNIPSENAVEELVKLIKENGDWVDPA